MVPEAMVSGGNDYGLHAVRGGQELQLGSHLKPLCKDVSEQTSAFVVLHFKDDAL